MIDLEDGWVRHDGGACPVAIGTIVDIRYRDGGTGHGLPAGVDTNPSWRDADVRFWPHESHHSDIVAYREAGVRLA